MLKDIKEGLLAICSQTLVQEPASRPRTQLGIAAGECLTPGSICRCVPSSRRFQCQAGVCAVDISSLEAHRARLAAEHQSLGAYGTARDAFCLSPSSHGCSECKFTAVTRSDSKPEPFQVEGRVFCRTPGGAESAASPAM